MTQPPKPVRTGVFWPSARWPWVASPTWWPPTTVAPSAAATAAAAAGLASAIAAAGFCAMVFAVPSQPAALPPADSTQPPAPAATEFPLPSLTFATEPPPAAFAVEATAVLAAAPLAAAALLSAILSFLSAIAAGAALATAFAQPPPADPADSTQSPKPERIAPPLPSFKALKSCARTP